MFLLSVDLKVYMAKYLFPRVYAYASLYLSHMKHYIGKHKENRENICRFLHFPRCTKKVPTIPTKGTKLIYQ